MAAEIPNIARAVDAIASVQQADGNIPWVPGGHTDPWNLVEAAMALETGEVMGRVWDMEGVKATRPQWLADGTLKLLAQLAPKKHPTVPADVPLAGDLAQSEEDRKALDLIAISTTLARPYLAPPGLPPERLRALRDAFMATMRDPEFLSEMAKLQLTVDPVSGDEMEKAVREAYELPDSLIQRVRQALSNE